MHEPLPPRPDAILRPTSLLRRTTASIVFLFLLPASALALDAVLVIPGIPGNSYSGSLGGSASREGSQVIAFENLADREYIVGTGSTPGELGNYSASFRIVKVSDDATIPLGERLATGNPIPTFEVLLVVGSGFVTYEFAATVITRVNTTGSLDGPFDEEVFAPCAVRVSSSTRAETLEWNFRENAAVFPGNCP